ncbi:hypothetical protein QBC37DRAFT_419750 [Rhypophila decipiens]|uniref:DUF6536 domain-containing protein n=1 Tax=Rhypophila decipiens TaxID=261697 RepID=A0AAN7BBR6_9PEZI|nr:hypothetical protein QBC37DRAFT_419750 [Rhypophila decipiens]
MRKLDVTQFTLRASSFLTCVALITVSLYLAVGVYRSDRSWMIACPPAIAVVGWDVVEGIIICFRSGRQLHPAVNLSAHFLLWSGSITCMAWLVIGIDSYPSSYGIPFAEYKALRPKIKALGTVLAALLGCLVAVHLALFVKYSLVLYRHNHSSPQPAGALVPTRETGPQEVGSGRNPKVGVKDYPKYRKTVLGFSLAAFITFALNLSFLVWAHTRSGSDYSGIGKLTTGSCSSIKKLNVGIHVAINVLSTVLLAGSNYCMQCLSAPDRDSVDVAHGEKRWLDIGIPSLRNIAYISPESRRLWWLLGISSLPLHLLYNSAVFPALSTSAYTATGVNEEYVANMAPLDRAALVYLSPSDCIAVYTASFQSTNSDVLVVAEGNSWTQTSSRKPDLQFYAVNIPGLCDKRVSYQWMCRQRYLETCTTCDTFLSAVVRDNITEWQPLGFPVKYCLSRPMEETCSLNFSMAIWWIVVAFNLLKVFLMGCVAWQDRASQPFLTVGDAIASFLRRPDSSTTNRCLLSKRDITKQKGDMIPSTPLPFKNKIQRKFSSASKTRWAICAVLYLLALTLCIFLLVFGLYNARGLPPSAMFTLGLGSVDAQTLITTDLSGRGPASLVANVLVANTPQLILSLLYFTYNGLFTAMALSDEWSSYALKQKGLRVSSTPEGSQRSTYWLQLPKRYSLPLVALSGVLHWLISQSIFVVYVEARSFLEHRTDELRERDFVTLGWSPVGTVCVVGVGGVMVLVLVVVAIGSLKSAMPVAAGCSMAIAAACHPVRVTGQLEGRPEGEKELRWGSVGENRGVKHCSFTSDSSAVMLLEGERCM